MVLGVMNVVCTYMQYLGDGSRLAVPGAPSLDLPPDGLLAQVSPGFPIDRRSLDSLQKGFSLAVEKKKEGGQDIFYKCRQKQVLAAIKNRK